MAQVYKTESLALVQHALDKLAQITSGWSGLEEQEKFKYLAKDIKSKTNISLKGDTLYKNMALRLRRENRSIVGFHTRYLNGLAQYVYDKNYDEVFSIVDPKATNNPKLEPTAQNKLTTQQHSPSTKKRKCYIVYTLEQASYAIGLLNIMKERLDCVPNVILQDTRKPFDFEKLYRKEEDAIGIYLIGMDLLRNETLFKSLVSQATRSEQPQESSYKISDNLYWKRTLHILLPDASHPSTGIATLEGRIGFVNYWKNYANSLIDQLPKVIQAEAEKNIHDEIPFEKEEPSASQLPGPHSSMFSDWISIHNLQFQGYPVVQKLAEEGNCLSFEASSSPSSLKHILTQISGEGFEQDTNNPIEDTQPIDAIRINQSLPDIFAGTYVLYHLDKDVKEGNVVLPMLRKSHLTVDALGGTFMIRSASGLILKGNIEARFGATVSIIFSGKSVENDDSGQFFKGNLSFFEEGILKGDYKGRDKYGNWEESPLLLVRANSLPPLKNWCLSVKSDQQEVAYEITVVPALNEWKPLQIPQILAKELEAKNIGSAQAISNSLAPSGNFFPEFQPSGTAYPVDKNYFNRDKIAS